ncbi:aminoglycoside phosphotransferase family protein [Streptomyces sp. NPDC091406]|uniref:aminoglycoside phosphotransferase family protein n=1 Tax=unclassified Streptomyces TaxID=2593676 RepID=UPI0038016C8D
MIARIAREGQSAAAAREVRVARWLARENVPAVRLVDVEQPVEADGRSVTFWAELPPQQGSVEDVADLLARLHSLTTLAIELGYLDPFVRVGERLHAATTIRDDDKQWPNALHSDLLAAWAERPAGLPDRAVDGDAWPGNIVRTAGGVLMMDLERFSVGPPEWDLVSTAVRAKTTGAVSAREYIRFCAVYGYDVTEGYPVLAHARELRMVTYAAQHATRSGGARRTTGSTVSVVDPARDRGRGRESFEVRLSAVLSGRMIVTLGAEEALRPFPPLKSASLALCGQVE